MPVKSAAGSLSPVGPPAPLKHKSRPGTVTLLVRACVREAESILGVAARRLADLQNRSMFSFPDLAGLVPTTAERRQIRHRRLGRYWSPARRSWSVGRAIAGPRAQGVVWRSYERGAIRQVASRAATPQVSDRPAFDPATRSDAPCPFRGCPVRSRKSAATVTSSYPPFCISATSFSSRSRCALSIHMWS